jgi:hypothetical protein
MVVFEFPPSNGASVQRILSVYRGFLDAGYIVDVLTAKPHAYSNVQPMSEDLMPENPHGQIVRTLAFDVTRHFSLFGKHWGALIRPDRWGLTWQPSALRAGRRLIKKNKPDLIWSSAPTPSPHVIAAKLSSLSHAPWVADYRDPMPYVHRSPGTYSALDEIHQQIDRRVLREAALLTFATRQVMDAYLSLPGDHPLEPSRAMVMENGFDNHLLQKTRGHLKTNPQVSSPFRKDRISLYYAGALYPDGRDPRPLFSALFNLKGAHAGPPLELVFQGAGDGSEFKEEIQTLGLEQDVHFLPAVPFAQSLQNMLQSDILVLIQDARFNQQIPGKLYEYLATGRPILLKTPAHSATAQLGCAYDGVRRGDDVLSLCQALRDTICEAHGNTEQLCYVRHVNEHTRESHVSRMIERVKELLSHPKEDRVKHIEARSC